MKKILIAEDDRFLATAYKIKLTKAGYEVKIAVDGVEALKALAEYVPDLVILDLIMPVKDGFAVLEELKKNDAWKKIPVIVASNLGQKEDMEKATNMGATDFVVKSDLSLENLIAKIRKIVGE
jgi:DNA-binding response OmpR family regulator